MKTKTDLDKIINDGYSLDFGQTFDETLDYFKKTFLLNGLILLIVSLAFALLIFLIFTVGAVADINAIEALFANPIILAIVFGSILFFSILIAPLYAGFLQLNRDIDTSDEVGVSSIFKHYTSKSLGQIIVYAIIIQVISSVANFIPFFGYIALLIVNWFTILAIPLIIFNNLSAVDALKYSAKIVAKNPGNILLILIVAVLISMAGLLALCIGIIFTIPIMYSAQYVLYKKCIGFDNEIIFDIEKKGDDFDQTINDIEKDIENL